MYYKHYVYIYICIYLYILAVYSATAKLRRVSSAEQVHLFSVYFIVLYTIK